MIDFMVARARHLEAESKVREAQRWPPAPQQARRPAPRKLSFTRTPGRCSRVSRRRENSFFCLPRKGGSCSGIYSCTGLTGVRLPLANSLASSWVWWMTW